MPQQTHVTNEQFDQATLSSESTYSDKTPERETASAVAWRMNKRLRREKPSDRAELRSIQWLICILFLLVLIPVGSVIAVLMLDPDWLTQRIYP